MFTFCTISKRLRKVRKQVDLFARVIPRRINVCAAFLRAFYALAVDDAGGWTGLPIDQLAAFLVEVIMNF
jgi:hypothetical protein